MTFKRVFTFIMCAAMVFTFCPGNYAGAEYQYNNSFDEPAEWKDPPEGGNVVLLELACDIARCLKDEDYAALSKFVHPKLGVRFTHYSFISLEDDLVFTAKEIKKAKSNDKVYTWGNYDGSGYPIEMTMEDYLDEVVYNKDYVNATRFGVDAVVQNSIMFDNLREIYPDSHFVDMYHPGDDPEMESFEWGILRLVFTEYNNDYYLVGIINHMHTM